MLTVVGYRFADNGWMTTGLGLARRRNGDGGFGPVITGVSEPEATALMCLAFDDEPARSWLAQHQRDDGSLGLQVGTVFRDVTSVSALALGQGPERERALDHVVGLVGRNSTDPAVTRAGWPWTDGAHGWTEPTAWGLLALRLFRPTQRDRIDDALAMFRERECVGGGWNYGSRNVLGVDQRPYVQTTALALLALGDIEPDLSDRGTAELERSWPAEADGLLSVATATCALQMRGSRHAAKAGAALRRAADRGTNDNVAFAWAAMAATGAGPWGAS